MFLYIDLSHKFLAHFFPIFSSLLLFFKNIYADLTTAKATFEVIATTPCCFSLSCKAQSLTAVYPYPFIDMKNLNHCLRSCRNVPCSDVVKVMTSKAAKGKQKIKQSMFLGIWSTVLSDIGSEPSAQVVHPSFVAQSHAKKTQKL